MHNNNDNPEGLWWRRLTWQSLWSTWLSRSSIDSKWNQPIPHVHRTAAAAAASPPVSLSFSCFLGCSFCLRICCCFWLQFAISWFCFSPESSCCSIPKGFLLSPECFLGTADDFSAFAVSVVCLYSSTVYKPKAFKLLLWLQNTNTMTALWFSTKPCF